MGEIRRFQSTIIENGVTWEWDPYTGSYCDYSEYDEQSSIIREQEKKRRNSSYIQWVQEGINIPFDKWDKRKERSSIAKLIIEDKKEYKSLCLNKTFKEFRAHKYSFRNILSQNTSHIMDFYNPPHKYGWKEFMEIKMDNKTKKIKRVF